MRDQEPHGLDEVSLLLTFHLIYQWHSLCLCAARTASSIVKTSPYVRATWLPTSLKTAKVNACFSASERLWLGVYGEMATREAPKTWICGNTC